MSPLCLHKNFYDHTKSKQTDVHVPCHSAKPKIVATTLGSKKLCCFLAADISLLYGSRKPPTLSSCSRQVFLGLQEPNPACPTNSPAGDSVGMCVMLLSPVSGVSPFTEECPKSWCNSVMYVPEDCLVGGNPWGASLQTWELGFPCLQLSCRVRPLKPQEQQGPDRMGQWVTLVPPSEVDELCISA